MLYRVVLATALIGAGASSAGADCFPRTEGVVVEGAVWSPDGNTMAFHSGSVISTLTVTGGPMTPVVDDGQWPTWSPDGTQLAYARTVGGSSPDIWVVDLDDYELRQITTAPGSDTHPDWSHNGEKIVYRSTRDDHIALYVYSFSTGLHDRLTMLEGSSPAWSPQDDQIVFERDASPEGAYILIVDYPSGVERQIFGPQNWLRYPRWHPFADSLIMIGGNDVGGVPAIMIYPLPSGPLLNVVCCLDDAAFPAWAPDGTRFSVSDAGDLLICYMATPVRVETWGAVKARFVEDR